MNTVDTKYLLGLLIITLLDGVGLIITFVLENPDMMLNGVLLMIITGLFAYDFFKNRIKSLNQLSKIVGLMIAL